MTNLFRFAALNIFGPLFRSLIEKTLNEIFISNRNYSVLINYFLFYSKTFNRVSFNLFGLFLMLRFPVIEFCEIFQKSS